MPFPPCVPSSHPYILLNYRGRPRDVVALGHEVGHGVHQYLAAANGALMATTPVTLAETAAAFSETLVFRGLLKKADDENQRRALLAVRVEHGLNAILRQVALYSFEQEVHRRRAEELTEKDLGDVWLRIQKELLGPSVRLEEEQEISVAFTAIHPLSFLRLFLRIRELPRVQPVSRLRNRPRGIPGEIPKLP